jgi:hypothetical protein
LSSTEVRPAPGARRKRRPTGAFRATLSRLINAGPARFDSWTAAVWVVVIGLDFALVSNPIVLLPFDESLHKACIATLIGVVATLPSFQLPRPSLAVLAVLAYGFASALWSTDPAATVHFTATLALVALLATVIASNADARTIAHGMLLGGVVVLGASWYAFHEGMPRADVPLGGIGFLAGVGGNRNALAYTMVLSLVFAVSFLPRHWWARSIWAMASGAILVGIFLSQSATGYLVAVIVLAGGAALMVSDRRRRLQKRSARRRWAVRLVPVVVLVGLLLGTEALSRALGRDPSTLSGRVPLWEAIWHSTTGVDRWFGSGWGSVWPHAWSPHSTSPAYDEIIERTGAMLYHGHSSLFDLLPEVGLVGVVIYALTYVQSVRRGLLLRDVSRGRAPARLDASRATLLGVFALVVFGLTEPIATIPLGWFVVVVLASGLRPVAHRAGRHKGAADRVDPAPM